MTTQKNETAKLRHGDVKRGAFETAEERNCETMV